jgi:hypothetical protein
LVEKNKIHISLKKKGSWVAVAKLTNHISTDSMNIESKTVFLLYQTFPLSIKSLNFQQGDKQIQKLK